jgi:hypothetical protein
MDLHNIEVHNVELKNFLEVLDTCSGDVFLVTDEGNVLNLKSKLMQIIGFAKLVEGGVLVGAKLKCSNIEDESKLFRFNLFGKET